MQRMARETVNMLSIKSLPHRSLEMLPLLAALSLMQGSAWVCSVLQLSSHQSDSRIRRVRIKTSENQDPRAKWYQLLHLKCLPIRYERFWKGSESKFKLHYKPESWERWNLDTVPKVYQISLGGSDMSLPEDKPIMIKAHLWNNDSLNSPSA